MEFKPNSALLVIDMLNDFIKEGGALVVPNAIRIVPGLQKALESAREKNVPVIYITDAHLPNDPEFADWPPHSIQDSWGGQVVDELAPQKNDYIIKKRRYSAFFGTDLELLLRELSIVNLYLTGVLTNICVYATALDARMRGFNVIVFKDLVASLSRETDEFIFGQLSDVLKAELL